LFPTVEVRALTQGRMPPGQVFKLGEPMTATILPDRMPLVDGLFK
jgi:hypothetical protein